MFRNRWKQAVCTLTVLAVGFWPLGVVPAAAEAEPPETVTLTGIIRDFQSSHPDFEESTTGFDPGIVETLLGIDGKPVYAVEADNPTVSGQVSFDQWYRDVQDINMSTSLPITLTRQPDGMYTYASNAFFPIDGQLFGNEVWAHNYHFTYEIHTQFTYAGGEVFTFEGDDDLWVFINDQLVIDLGGVHGPMTGQVALDAVAETLGLEVGGAYDFALFFAERHTVGSNFKVTTSIVLEAPLPDPEVAAEGTGAAEGSEADLDVTFTNFGAGPYTATVDWGDGSDPEDLGEVVSPFTATHSYADNGEYEATVTVTDAADLTGEATATLVITNVAPTVVIEPVEQPSVSGGTATFAITITDPGTLDAPWTYSIDWGDESPAQEGSVDDIAAPIEVSHAYMALGTYPVIVRVADKDEAEGEATATVTVGPLPVLVNVKPGSSENPINPKALVPVAVLTTEDFDASTIDVATIRFGTPELLAAGGGATPKHGRAHIGDALELDEQTLDGDDDLIMHFDASEAGIISPEITEACITGMTTDGIVFYGCDAVRLPSGNIKYDVGAGTGTGWDLPPLPDSDAEPPEERRPEPYPTPIEEPPVIVDPPSQDDPPADPTSPGGKKGSKPDKVK